MGFSYQISNIGGDIGNMRAYRAFILDTIYNEILITKSWFSIIDISYQIKRCNMQAKTIKKFYLYAIVQ